MDCLKTENYLKERARMCRSFNICKGCPLYDKHEHTCIDSPIKSHGGANKKTRNLESTIIVQKWSDEHPQKTYKDDFFEKFPDAPKETDGTPKCCREIAYNKAWSDCYCNCVDRCYECWNEVIPK